MQVLPLPSSPAVAGTQERLGGLVQRLMEASPGLDVIIASRAAFPLPFAARCALNCMPPDEAVALLREAGAGQTAVSNEQAGRIAELCGFNALELSLVGGLLGGRSCTPEVKPLSYLGAATVVKAAPLYMLVCTLTPIPPPHPVPHQDVIAAGSAVAASDQTYIDPIGAHVERLRTWWTGLLGPALGQRAQLAGAMALSAFAGSFDANSAVAVLKAVPGSNAERLLQALPVLSVLQDAGAWTGEAGTARCTRHAACHVAPCHAIDAIALAVPPTGTATQACRGAAQCTTCTAWLPPFYCGNGTLNWPQRWRVRLSRASWRLAAGSKSFGTAWAQRSSGCRGCWRPQV
jgi:hypothetical protein